MYKNKHDFTQFFLANHPLTDEQTTTERLFDLWNTELVIELEKLYEERKINDAFIPMCKGTILFLYALYLTNDHSIETLQIDNWQETIANFNVLPVNIMDRLAFIIEHPTQYHSFIQLKQLFTELIKKHAIKKSIG